MLAHCNRVTSILDVLDADFERLGDPAVDAAEDDGVLVYLLLLHALDHPLLEAQFLIDLELIFTLAKRVVLRHALEQVLTDHVLCFFKI